MVYVIGYGAMAKAIVDGFKRQEIEVTIVGRSKKRLQEVRNEWGVPTLDLHGFSIHDRDIILAIKPHALPEVAQWLQGEARVLYSILAGVSLHTLKEHITAANYVRAMPNVAAAQGASMTALTGDEEVKTAALELFGAIGDTIWLESEEKLEIATLIAGSGPAFLALVAEGLADGGVAGGLKRGEAYRLVAGLFRSYASIADQLPATIKDQVMSPKGVTAKGIRTLENTGVRGAFMEAVLEGLKKE
ncbi:MAG: pyrroline-5-carboxylate reductase [Nitratiruptor sp.]|nr:pyrroline-5-carboxylate reductase [Nitratiruptor sp.]NPA83386.1 pyrroline-5-carboxylate reductase [Campylobacterota bacterium]